MSYEKFVMDARYLAYMRDLLEARASDEFTIPATDGEGDSLIRAHAQWRRMLQRYQPPAIDPGLDETLREFISHKKREIEKGSQS